jgi:hypothetical protein
MMTAFAPGYSGAGAAARAHDVRRQPRDLPRADQRQRRHVAEALQRVDPDLDDHEPRGAYADDDRRCGRPPDADDRSGGGAVHLRRPRPPRGNHPGQPHLDSGLRRPWVPRLHDGPSGQHHRLHERRTRPPDDDVPGGRSLALHELRRGRQHVADRAAEHGGARLRVHARQPALHLHAAEPRLGERRHDVQLRRGPQAHEPHPPGRGECLVRVQPVLGPAHERHRLRRAR